MALDHERLGEGGDGALVGQADGEPSLKAIWLGLQRVLDVAATIQALSDEAA